MSLIQSDLIYKCVVGDFDANDAFSVVDLVYEAGYLSASCFKKDKVWQVEVLSNEKISPDDVKKVLSGYKFSIIENGKLEEVNWVAKSFENFKAITVGSFYIYGPHLKPKPRPADKIAIEIAAATAFGTGEHPTTNRCLIACETFFDSEKHRSVLDVGCGSGILSIALAKLGARSVLSCDNDAEAVRVSRQNMLINGTQSRVRVFQNHECEFNSSKYDFIVSNILAPVLNSMSQNIVESLSDSGILILSGFVSDDSSVEQNYTSLGLKVKHKYDLNGWTTLVLSK